MKKPKLIYIEWADAISPLEDTWMQLEIILDWAEDENYWVSQVGWLLKETNKYILLASRINEVTSESRTKLGEINYGGVFKIPKTWIRKRKEISNK